MSANVSPTPPPSHSPASRMPGVSMSSAPDGSVSRSRVTVVWRPRPPLCSLTAPIAWRSKPSRALTSVDLPAPDGPSRTLVVCGSSSASSGAIDSRVVDAHRRPRRSSPSRRAIARAEAPPSGSRSAFVSTSAAGTPPGGGQRDDPLAAALVGLGQRLDDEHELDVRGQHLAATGAPAARRTTLPRRSSTAAITPSPSSATQSPVVGVRSLGGAHAPARGDEPRRGVAAVGDEPAAAVLGEHAGGGVRRIAELRELGGEIWSPPDGGGWGMHGEVLHGFVRGAGAASEPGRCPGRVIRRPRRG